MKSHFSISRRPEKDGAKLTYEEGLRLDLKLAKWELDNAYAGFDYATDPDLIDCYIYELNAAMKRYKYLLTKFTALQKEKLVQAEDGLVFVPADSELIPAPPVCPSMGMEIETEKAADSSQESAASYSYV